MSTVMPYTMYIVNTYSCIPWGPSECIFNVRSSDMWAQVLTFQRTAPSTVYFSRSAKNHLKF